MSNKTAILFFHRAETEEKKRKSFRASVVTYLNSRIRKLIDQSGLPVIEHIDIDSEDNSIQERFYFAVKNTFERGFDKVIVLGNDCPQLQLGDIQKASNQLETNDLVIGPDLRGGAYLLGISRSIFTKEWALSLPWHTCRYAEVAASEIEDVSYLNNLADFNSAKEVVYFRKIKFRKSLIQYFLELFKSFKKIIFEEIETSFSITGYKLLRAPPVH